MNKKAAKNSLTPVKPKTKKASKKRTLIAPRIDAANPAPTRPTLEEQPQSGETLHYAGETEQPPVARGPVLICEDCSRVIPPGQVPVVLEWGEKDKKDPAHLSAPIKRALHVRCDQARRGITRADVEAKKASAEAKETVADPTAKRLAKLKTVKEKAASSGALDLRTIHIVNKANPRKEGSHGWKSYNVMREGMTVDEYIKAGGRKIDLAWDADKKNVELKEAK